MQCVGKGCLTWLQISPDLKQNWVLILCHVIESLGFLKNSSIKEPQNFLDCYAGNKVAPKNIIKAIKASTHKTVKCQKEGYVHDSAFPPSPVVSKLWYSLSNWMIAFSFPQYFGLIYSTEQRLLLFICFSSWKVHSDWTKRLREEMIWLKAGESCILFLPVASFSWSGLNQTSHSLYPPFTRWELDPDLQKG